MTDETGRARVGAGWGTSSAPLIFGATVFASAALIFLVEPMIAKLVLPVLGGSPMVWNTCMAFFQAALLVGYLYAHLLQRVKALRTQVLIHAVVLVAAILVLPLRVSQLMGAEPGGVPPALWLVGVLALSLGPPFAALSATAPLAQAWYARVRSGGGADVNPYVLYSASNLGSLIALLAYPILVEPLLSLHVQTIGWSIGYIGFVLVMCLAAYSTAKAKAVTPKLSEVVEQEDRSRKITWIDRLTWIGLAAAPSSLMLGVTTHMTTDIASAPFLWVVPLALYLITFILAFASKPVIHPYNLLTLQAGMVIVVAYLFGMSANTGLLLEIFAHLASFFFTVLLCHSVLAFKRPHPSRLTEFYLLLALGGVIGGAFNAFIAPMVLNGVWEYPIVLVLACLARPWGEKPIKLQEIIVIAIAAAAFLVLIALILFGSVLPPAFASLLNLTWRVDLPFVDNLVFRLTFLNTLMAIGAVTLFLARGRAVAFSILLGAMIITPILVGRPNSVIYQDRSFFGVVRVSEAPVIGLSDSVYSLAHGTTLHGAQSRDPQTACTPLVYYAPNTPIGQVFTLYQSTRPAIRVGAVGMGTGTVASYTRPGDALRFYEIDQNVVDMATNPEYFTYINGCAEGEIDWVLGDARLSLEKEPDATYDVLLVDAFSSDAVPAHLLTVEAMRTYLRVIKPDGVIIMHVSNRHLSLSPAVAAVAEAAGGVALYQYHFADPDLPPMVDTGEEALIIGRSGATMAQFLAAGQPWVLPAFENVRPWTDDYTNLFGAMIDSLRDKPGFAGSVLRRISGED